MSLLFGTSAVYHRVSWSTPTRHALVARLDHSMIFLFIAGTYTPFALLAMPDRTGRTVLAVVWAGAVGGVLLKTSWITAPRWLTVPIYLGARLGGRLRLARPAAARRRGRGRCSSPPAALLYTAGGIVYALQRPDPRPQVFGFHEVFHLCTVVAATCHMVAVWLAVYSG